MKSRCYSTALLVLAFGAQAGAQGASEEDTQADSATSGHQRDGLFFRAAIGPAWGTNMIGVGDVSQSFDGFGLNYQLAIGGAVGDKLALGFGITSAYIWTGDLPGTPVSYAFAQNNFGMFFSVYPSPDSGLHVDVMPALALYTPSFESDNVSFIYDNTEVGFGLTGGVGYDWWVSESWSIGVEAQVQWLILFKDAGSFNVVSPGLLATFTYW